MSILRFTQISAALVFIYVRRSEGLTYHCSSGDTVAYTPTGTFQKNNSADLAISCSLRIPKSLFRGSTAILEVYIKYINASTGTGSTCDTEYILIAGSRFCAGISENTVTFKKLQSTIGDSINITYSTNFVGATFLLHYTVYTDICDTTDLIIDWPVILSSTRESSLTANCSTNLNVAHFDKLIIKAENSYRLNTCNYEDIALWDGDRRICQGQECINPRGINISNVEILKAARNSRFSCTYYWKFTVFSKTMQQDICSLTGSSLTLPEGKLTSPGYLQGYTGSVDCAVTLSGYDVVSVTVMYYKLSKRICDAVNPCNCGDRLIINQTAKCGRYIKPTNRTYVGTDVPLSIQLITRSESLSSASGFYLTYKSYSESDALDICNLPFDLELSAPVLIMSPNFPNSYPNNKNCEARIDVSKVRRVRVQLVAFSMEDYSFNNCAYDYLSIGDNRYCGRKDGYVEEIEVNTVVLRFRSDNNKTSTGFYLSIEGVELPVTSTPEDSTPPAGGSSTTTMRSSPLVSSSRITGGQIIVSETNMATLPVSEKATGGSTTSYKPSRSVSEPHERDEEPHERDEEPAISYNEPSHLSVKIQSATTVEYGNNKRYREASSGNKTQDNAVASDTKTCPVPWYYWICSLIAILLAVFIIITVCLIKLKRLKVAMNGQQYSDTESSRDGLTNPVYYNSSHFPQRNGDVVHNGGNPCFTNRDRVPLGTRVVINKNSIQTTV